MLWLEQDAYLSFVARRLWRGVGWRRGVATASILHNRPLKLGFGRDLTVELHDRASIPRECGLLGSVPSSLIMQQAVCNSSPQFNREGEGEF